MNNQYRHRDWLQCPNCESEDVGARDYYTELIFECHDCGEQRVMIHGKHRPLSHADPDRIKARLRSIREGDDGAEKSWWTRPIEQ